MRDTRLLRSVHDVIRCLNTYTDWWQPATSSVLQVGAARRGGGIGDGLHPGILETLEERTELVSRIGLLSDREQMVLFCFYVAQLAPNEIARTVGISTRQCFRLRIKAVRRIVELGREDGQEDAA